jgi:hypothetical protein
MDYLFIKRQLLLKLKDSLKRIEFFLDTNQVDKSLSLIAENDKVLTVLQKIDKNLLFKNLNLISKNDLDIVNELQSMQSRVQSKLELIHREFKNDFIYFTVQRQLKLHLRDK